MGTFKEWLDSKDVCDEGFGSMARGAALGLGLSIGVAGGGGSALAQNAPREEKVVATSPNYGSIKLVKIVRDGRDYYGVVSEKAPREGDPRVELAHKKAYKIYANHVMKQQGFTNFITTSVNRSQGVLVAVFQILTPDEVKELESQ